MGPIAVETRLATEERDQKRVECAQPKEGNEQREDAEEQAEDGGYEASVCAQTKSGDQAADTGVDDEERKDAELRIRLTKDERERLDAAAQGNTSTWARELLLRAAKRKT